MDADRRPRFLIIGNYAPTLLSFRGPLMRRLLELGYHVVAVVPLNDLDAETETTIRARLTKMGVELCPVPLTRTGLDPLHDLGYLKALRKIMLQIDPDRILAYTIKPVVYAGLAARSIGHTHYYPMFSGLGYSFSDGPGFKRTLVRSVVRTLLKSSLKSAQVIIFQNSDDEALIRSRGIIRSEQRTIVVSGSGVDMDFYSSQSIEAAPTTVVFIMVCRVLIEKGVREYAAAAKALKARYPDCKFLLLGPMDKVNPTSPNEAEVASWTDIEYHGSTDDVRPYLQKASVFVLPSYYREGVPRSALEALATGRAIVTTDRPGCRETVIDGTNGFCVPAQDIGRLTEALEKFIRNPSLCKAMGRESQELAKRRFDVNIINGEILRTLGIERR